MILTYYQAVELMSCLPVLLTHVNSPINNDADTSANVQDELFIDKLPVFSIGEIAQFYPYMQE